MKDSVLIKSFPHGINMILKEDVPFDVVLDEVALKFAEAKAFFGKASMALSIEGRILSEVEELRILDAIRSNSNLRIACIVSKDEEGDKPYVKALGQVDQRLVDGSEGQFYKGSLKNGEVIETEGSIVILGDVHPGCAIISSKNVIVLGGLYGEAYAGGNGQEGAYVVALEMEPERLKIGDFKYKTNGKTSKWGLKSKVQPKIAYVKNERIVFDGLTKELLGSF